MFPTLFVSHGAPTFALQPGQAGPQLAAFTAALPRPRAVLVVSPHWMTAGLEVSTAAMPATLYDFGGFPDELYTLSYRAAGAPELAGQVAALLAEQGVAVRQNPGRGLDHGAWVPLMYLYPQADVPVFQLSLPRLASPRDYLMLGRLLAPLARQDVLVMASGSITHNLQDAFAAMSGGAPEGAAYAREFMDWMAARLAAGDLEALLDYRRQAPHAKRAHPTDEHLMPLFVALGAAGEGAAVARLEGGIDLSVLGMDSYAFTPLPISDRSSGK